MRTPKFMYDKTEDKHQKRKEHMFTALTTLAQDLNYTYTAPTSTSGGSSFSPVALIISLAIAAVVIVAMWKVFTKAGRPGWAAIVPIYNELQMLSIVGRPWWWIFLSLIPVVNIVVGIIILNDLAKSFGKGVGMTLLLLFLPVIGYPILGFGDAKYQGPSASGGSTPAAPASPASPTPPAAPTAPTPPAA